MIYIPQWLVDTARQHIDTMVQKIAEMSNKFNRQICKQYDNIVKKSSYQAENTRELVQLIEYVENLKVGEMLQLLVSTGDSLSLSFSRSLSPPSLSVCLSHSLPPPSVCLSVCPPTLSLFLSLSLYVCLSVSLSLSIMENLRVGEMLQLLVTTHGSFSHSLPGLPWLHICQLLVCWLDKFILFFPRTLPYYFLN